MSEQSPIPATIPKPNPWWWSKTALAWVVAFILEFPNRAPGLLPFVPESWRQNLSLISAVCALIGALLLKRKTTQNEENSTALTALVTGEVVHSDSPQTARDVAKAVKGSLADEAVRWVVTRRLR